MLENQKLDIFERLNFLFKQGWAQPPMLKNFSEPLFGSNPIYQKQDGKAKNSNNRQKVTILKF